jgi:hypothetical protein
MSEDLIPGLHEDLVTDELLERIQRAREQGWQIEWKSIDDAAIAAGTVLAVTAARLAGIAPGLAARSGPASGVHGLAALVESVPFLAELARRGVKAAVFEGVAVA